MRITEKCGRFLPKVWPRLRNGEQRFVSIMWIAHIEQELRPAQAIGAAQAATRR